MGDTPRGNGVTHGMRTTTVPGNNGTAWYPSAQGACMSVVRTVIFPALRLLVWR